MEQSRACRCMRLHGALDTPHGGALRAAESRKRLIQCIFWEGVQVVGRLGEGRVVEASHSNVFSHVEKCVELKATEAGAVSATHLTRVHIKPQLLQTQRM
jgi:hypothetical protein